MGFLSNQAASLRPRLSAIRPRGGEGSLPIPPRSVLMKEGTARRKPELRTAAVKQRVAGTIWPRARDQSGPDAVGCGDRHVAEMAQKPQP